MARPLAANAGTSYHSLYVELAHDFGDARCASESVVDTEMRLQGCKPSACAILLFPDIIGSHTMSPVVVVARKCTYHEA